MSESVKAEFKQGQAERANYIFSIGGRAFLSPAVISVRVVRWQEFESGKLTGDTVVTLPKCTGYSVSYEGIRTAESFDKWVTIQVSPQKKWAWTEKAKRLAGQIISTHEEEIAPEITLVTVGFDVLKDHVLYTVAGWAGDCFAKVIYSGVVAGCISETLTQEKIIKIMNESYLKIKPAFACIDSGYLTSHVNNFCDKNPDLFKAVKHSHLKIENDLLDSDDCLLYAKAAKHHFDEVKKPNLGDSLKKAADSIKAFSNAIGDDNLFEMENFPSLAKERLSSFNPAKIIVTSTPGSEDNFIKHFTAKRKETLWLSDDFIKKMKENSNFDILKELKKPNSAAVVSVANDDGDFMVSLNDFMDHHLSQGKELCHAAKTLENALATLDRAKSTEDDYLITCAELAVEESRNELARWIELFENT